MGRSSQKIVALTGTVAGGLVVLVVTSLLTVDAVAARQRLPRDEARVDDLLAKVQKDAAYAAELQAEYDRQTERSLGREARQGKLAWVLTLAAVVLVVSSKRLVALRGRLPVLPKKVHVFAAEAATKPPEEHPDGGVSRAGAAVVDDADLSYVDEVVAREGRGRKAVIPILQALQSHYRYLPEAALRRVCRLTEISAAQLVGVATFYTQFRRTPVGRHLVKICHGTACHVAGATRVMDEVQRGLGIPADQDTDRAGNFTVERVACLGCCTLAPVVQVDEVTHGHMSPDTVLETLLRSTEPVPGGGARGRPATDEAGAEDGEIRIGLGSCCIASGSEGVQRALQEALARTGAKPTVKRVGCVGMCHQTPLIEVKAPGQASAHYGRVRPEYAKSIVRRHFKAASVVGRLRDGVADAIDRLRNGTAQQVTGRHSIELRDPPVAAFVRPQKHIATEHCGLLDPTDLDEYMRHGGFEAWQRCLRGLRPEDVIEQIRQSGLRGRGGAGFPTAEKWLRVRAAAGERKHVICNGDEGDPGAFMDRMLMESYPYRIIEGVAIAAYAVGAAEGCFYIRREYVLAAERIRGALRECERRGLLGTREGLQLEVVEGAGAFVCGEESALIATLEGRRGTPGLRPPYPAERGLWGRPTLVSNVETYAVVPWILRNGPGAFAALGTESSKGTKVFALTGKVSRGGLIEVPMGVTIREIVEEIGGGVKGGSAAGGWRHGFKAVQIGGPSGGCVPAELADTPVDYEALARVGAMMGSGGLVVLDETDCMVDMARYFLSFTQSQSCGQCAPCRIGTRRLLDILERLCSGEGRSGDLEELEHLARMVSRGSLCGLGRTAPNPVLTTLRYFREEYEAHLEGRCPAGRCKALITYQVTEACSGCTLCAQHCPADAIEMRPYERHEIDAEKCTRCDVCRVKCPEEAIEVV